MLAKTSSILVLRRSNGVICPIYAPPYSIEEHKALQSSAKLCVPPTTACITSKKIAVMSNDAEVLFFFHGFTTPSMHTFLSQLKRMSVMSCERTAEVRNQVGTGIISMAYFIKGEYFTLYGPQG